MKREYRFGFSFWGAAAFLLVMIPNILWTVCPPKPDLLAGNSSPYPFLNGLMSVSQWAMVGILLLVKPARQQWTRLLAVFTGVCLGAYYLLWILYFLGAAAPGLFLGLAVFPCAFFALAALGLGNLPVLLPLAVFAGLHIGITMTNFCKF